MAVQPSDARRPAQTRPALAGADPELAAPGRRRGAAPGRHPAPDPQRELRVAAVLEATGSVLHQQVLRGLPGQALLRGPAGHRPGRDARHRPRQGAVRRRARQRAAVLRLPGQPRRLPGVPAARRHRDGHGACRWAATSPTAGTSRPPARGSAACSTASAATPAASTSTRCATWRCASGPKLIFCGGTAIPRTIDFAAFAEIAREVGAVLAADIAHIAGLVAGGAHPSPVGTPTSSPRPPTRPCAARAARMMMSASRARQGASTRPSSPACRAARTTTPPPPSRSPCTRRPSPTSATTPTRSSPTPRRWPRR